MAGHQALIAGALAAFLVGAAVPVHAAVEVTPMEGTVTASGPVNAAPARHASLEHAAFKATTFKVGSTVANLALLSYATGDLIGGAALTTFMLGSSWVIYTANDYLWDYYRPPPVKESENEAFDAGADVWRNTGKFLTYKPIVASLKLGSLYYYTGSATIAGVFGAASILTNTAVFYVNNVAWDFYDWSTQGVTPAGKP